jgi:hypothetical protein
MSRTLVTKRRRPNKCIGYILSQRALVDLGQFVVTPPAALLSVPNDGHTLAQ